MSRIRSIHPGLFSDESFMTLTVEDPLCIPLLIGLWTEADDDGVFEWKPLTIKAKTLPAAQADIPAMLERLIALNLIMRFEVDGKPYGAIRNFKQWQRPKLPKVKYPKTPIATAYVGGNTEALPQHLPSDGEMSPQREEVGGSMEEVEPPLAPQGAWAGDIFDEIESVFPRSPNSKPDSARRWFSKQTEAIQRDILTAARKYAAWFEAEQKRRNRPMSEALGFVPPLNTWLSSGAWKSAEALADSPVIQVGELVVLARDDPRIPRLEARRGKPFVFGDRGTVTVRKSEIDATDGNMGEKVA